MKWEKIREHYPNQWVLMEAIDACTDDGKRIVQEGSVVNYYKDSKVALDEYKDLHRQSPERELYVVHTSNQELEILERKWLGIRI
jgi:hypothetical protein